MHLNKHGTDMAPHDTVSWAPGAENNISYTPRTVPTPTSRMQLYVFCPPMESTRKWSVWVQSEACFLHLHHLGSKKNPIVVHR